MAVVEQWIRDSDNQIKLQLTEDGAPISGNWTALDIFFGSVHLNRTSSGNGIDLSAITGILTINPGDLQSAEVTAVAGLRAGQFYKAKIVVTSATADDGAVFGGQGEEAIVFRISDKPS